MGRRGAVYLTNAKGELIGYKDKNRLLVRQGSRYRPARINELGIPWLQASYRHYKKQERPRFTYLHQDSAYIAAFVPFPRSFGKDWRMAIVVPVVVKGRKEPIQLYELLDQRNRKSAERWEALCAQTQEVFDLYLRREWSRALTLLETIEEQHPHDPIVQLYLRRCRDYRDSPPPDDWQGIVYLHHK